LADLPVALRFGENRFLGLNHVSESRPLRGGNFNPFKEPAMSAIVKQPVPAPQAKTAADLLAGATKKGKSSNHLVYVGEVGQEAAARWLALNAKLAETDRELGLARDQVLDLIRPWHEETCARRRAHEATVVVETPTGALRVSFQHRYTKLALDREEHLRQLLGENFERYFKRTVSLKVKKEVAEDPERLDAMVLALAEALGTENFASLFEVEQSLAPTKTYTETSCQFPAETRAALNLIGVRQIVALAAK
jgi:hypothetical protein